MADPNLQTGIVPRHAACPPQLHARGPAASVAGDPCCKIFRLGEGLQPPSGVDDMADAWAEDDEASFIRFFFFNPPAPHTGIHWSDS
ncbi:hypothetical protein [Variovorax sp. Root411]|uniref:hypothetical protein n=1 Tax=Variovorax sp. Root411 TaxID=1736530 RepID=UPI0012FBA8FC|nr:hypothetical protein [Variovorax sp. Root411]